MTYHPDTFLRPSSTHPSRVAVDDLIEAEYLRAMDTRGITVDLCAPRVRIAQARGGPLAHVPAEAGVTFVLVEIHDTLYVERYTTQAAAEQRVVELRAWVEAGGAEYPSDEEHITLLAKQLARLLDIPLDMLCDVPTDSAAAIFYAEAVDSALERKQVAGGDGSFTEVVDLAGVSIWQETDGEHYASLPGDAPDTPSLGPFGSRYDAIQGATRALLARRYAAQAAE